MWKEGEMTCIKGEKWNQRDDGERVGMKRKVNGGNEREGRGMKGNTGREGEGRGMQRHEEE